MHELEALKRDVFYGLLNAAGRVYVHVRYSAGVELGRRGFKGDEVENGIVLIFNSKMRFQWGEHGIECTLVFGSTPEKCFVPSADVVAVYSPELGVQYVVDHPEDEADESEETETREPEAHGDKVIKVDFSGRGRKRPGGSGR